MPAVDDTYPYLAIPVQTTFGLVWYVITVQVQGIPQVLATLPSQGNFGTMSDGVLFNASNSALSATDLSIPTGVQPDSITSEIRNFYVNPLRLSVFSPPTKMKPTCSSSCPGVDALMATMQSNNYSFDAVCIAYTAFLEALGQNAATKYAIADVIFNRKAAIPTQRQPVQSWPRTYVGIVTQGGQFDVYAVRPARKIAVQSQNNLNATIFQIKTELANVGCSGILNYLQMYTDVLDYVTNRLSGSGPQGILDSRVTWFYSPCGYQGPVNPIVGCPAGYSSPSGILNFYEQNGNGIQGGPCGQNLFRFFYQDFCYIWQRPLTGGFPKISASMIQGLCTQGPITTPYVVSIVVNGFAMSISGNGRTGIFSGQIPSLVPNSKNTFLMTVITNSGRVLSETRSNITVTN